MIEENNTEDFINILEETGTLLKFFPSDYDFNIDPYDPVIDDLIYLINKFDAMEQLLESSAYYRLLIRGINNHVSLEIRYDISEMLSKFLDDADEETKRIITNAIYVLEDISINPSLIGLINMLYEKNIFRLLDTRTSLEEQEINEHMVVLVRELVDSPSDDIIDRVVEQGKYILPAIADYIFEYNWEDEQIMILAHVLTQIPCYQSAFLLMEILFSRDYTIDEIDYFKSIIRDSKIAPLVCDYLINDASFEDIDFFDKWMYYDYLMALNDYRVFDLLRAELIDRERWSDNTPIEDLEIAEEFYGDVVEWLIQLNDRRAVPVFIKLLYYGKKMGFPRKILTFVKDMLKTTPWYEEIERGVRLLKEGEVVFIGQDEDMAEYIEQRKESFYQTMSVVKGQSPSIEDLQNWIKQEQNRWNEAYHDALDGLRPIDIPIPQVQFAILSDMEKDFQKSPYKKDNLEEFEKFQSIWLITPNVHYNNEIPLAVLLKERASVSQSYALQQHFRIYKKKTLNGLYFKALESIDTGDTEMAKLYLDAILEIEPNYRFATRLKKRISPKEEIE